MDRCSVFAADVFSFRVNVFTFGPDVFSEEGERAEGRGVRRDEAGEGIPRSAGSGQVFGGRGDDGGVSTLSGRCVQFLARCVHFSG